jgi:hypothetical protein
MTEIKSNILSEQANFNSDTIFGSFINQNSKQDLTKLGKPDVGYKCRTREVSSKAIKEL